LKGIGGGRLVHHHRVLHPVLHHVALVRIGMAPFRSA
jgi:hypothetical protein